MALRKVIPFNFILFRSQKEAPLTTATVSVCKTEKGSELRVGRVAAGKSFILLLLINYYYSPIKIDQTIILSSTPSHIVFSTALAPFCTSGGKFPWNLFQQEKQKSSAGLGKEDFCKGKLRDELQILWWCLSIILATFIVDRKGKNEESQATSFDHKNEVIRSSISSHMQSSTYLASQEEGQAVLADPTFYFRVLLQWEQNYEREGKDRAARGTRKGVQAGAVRQDNKNELNRSLHGAVGVEEDGVRQVIAEVAEGLLGLPRDTGVRLGLGWAVANPHRLN